jgi:hypothetical protein
MASVSLNFPAVPAPQKIDDVVIALGRMTIAWSSSEFYLLLLLTRLMASAPVSSADGVSTAMRGRADMVVDTNAVSALYFAVESSRGRRRLVQDLAHARRGDGYLVEESYDRIARLLNEHDAIARSRNKYAHTAMGLSEDGSYVLLDKKLMISHKDGSRLERSSLIRTNNNKVQAKMIDGVTDRLESWIGEAKTLLTSIATKPTAG